jgi:hypothetical protein
MEDLMKIKVGG